MQNNNTNEFVRYINSVAECEICKRNVENINMLSSQIPRLSKEEMKSLFTGQKLHYEKAHKDNDQKGFQEPKLNRSESESVKEFIYQVHSSEWPNILVRLCLDEDVFLLDSMLRNGVDPKVIDPRTGQTLLMIACSINSFEIARCLLKYGVDPNQTNKNSGFFPLLIAVSENSVRMTEILLEAGANPNQHNEVTGIFPLFYASSKGIAQIIEILLKSGADPNKTCVCNDKEVVTSLIEAICSRDMYATKLLIEYGADVNYKTEPKKNTALIAAVMDGEHKIVSYLLENGADPRIMNYDGRTAIDCLKLVMKVTHDTKNQKFVETMRILRFASKLCVMCEKSTNKNLCSRCKKVRYCSAECQKKDWPSHKMVCEQKQ